MERQFAALLAGDFLTRPENVLVFGNPGGGKTHLLCALGHELIKQEQAVYFTPCVLLVQRLLLAKAELWLEKELKRPDRFAVLIIDDLGCVQPSRDEMEVLFTLLAHRYERRSMYTQNFCGVGQSDQDHAAFSWVSGRRCQRRGQHPKLGSVVSG